MTRLPDPAAQAREALQDGAPVVMLLGRAGTGKSHFIRELIKDADRPQVILAPTGLAAMNIGGQTVHSFFGLPPRPLVGFSEKPNWFFTKAARGASRIIVDEISMLRADVLDAMDAQLRAARRSSRPFGGVQMLLVGDFHQLPPVVRGAEAEILAEAGYASPFAFSAHVLREADVVLCELDEVRRQSDPYFIDLLARLREDRDVEGAIEDLNERCVGAVLDQEPVLLAATNAVADAYNRRGLEGLGGQTGIFNGAFKGERAPKEPPPGDRLPAPAQLILRRGARVIFTQNDPEGRWVNGSLGRVVEFEPNRIAVKLDANGEIHEVAKARWPQARWVWNDALKELEPKEDYSYEQFPLAHAWALTIHKAQGMTLDAVEIDLGRGAFAAGQTYVALSRARSLEGLRLARPLKPRDVQIDPVIEEGLARFR